MKKIILLLQLAILNLVLFSQDNPEWIRYASISPDGQKIAFTYKGDLYTVPVTGGVAQPLTFHEAHDFMPVWSHDGKKIAFASDRFGNFDVFIINTSGGEPLRLTYHSNGEFPYSFSFDDKNLIFGAQRQDDVLHRQYPSGSQPEVYQVSTIGGRVSQLWTIPAEDIKVSKNGQQYIYHDKKGGENAWRKHHTSSITRDIWLYDKVTDKHSMITSFKGEDRNPVYTDNDQSIYYLSEESGSFNVHKLSLSNPKQNQQITNFKNNPVRFLSISDEGMLCFTYNGELYTQKSDGQANKIKVTVNRENKTNNEKIIPITGNISEMAVSPNGKEVAYIVRGEVFVSSVEGGVTKRITNTPGQERFISFSPDGKSLLYASERNKLWSIYQSKIARNEEPYFYASTLINEELLINNTNENYQPQFSPDGKEIAFIENLRSLKIYHIANKQIRTLLSQKELYYMQDGDQYFSWSPDGKWLLAKYAPVMSNPEVVLLAADGSGKIQNLTESGYNDFQPKWVNGGKQMIWFSDKNGLRSYANSGNRQTDVYSMFFTQEAWDRFNLSKEDFTLLKDLEEKAEKDKKEKEEKDKKDKKDKKTVESKNDSAIVINFNGLKDRKIRLSTFSSDLSDAVLSKDGEKLYYLASFEKGLNLWSTNLRTKETKMELGLDAESGQLIWDKEMKYLFLLADGKISRINMETLKQESIGIKGELNLDIVAERKSMFDHVWKRTKEMFYISTFHGANWDELEKVYEAKLSDIGNSYEFAEMLSEMLGELNVSHSGANYRPSDPNGDKTASLGFFIDYSYTGNGLKIAEIINGGPLDKEKIKVNKGMIIEEIDGIQITSNIDYAKLLNRKEGKFTLLKITDPLKSTSQFINIKPISLGEENSLIYKRWVRANELLVDSLSKGLLGYVHIPGMSDGPYRNVYERVMGKYYDKKGIIIDTRFNGGGDLVSDLAMFFTGKKFLDYAIESRILDSEPTFRWTKPSVAMVNEANYSDGHCFACGYQDLGIGKLIGMPVPGTCSWAGWETLQDGLTTWGAIPVSSKNSKGQWVENIETVPDILIKNNPNEITKGKDQQLQKAIDELLNETK